MSHVGLSIHPTRESKLFIPSFFSALSVFVSRITHSPMNEAYRYASSMCSLDEKCDGGVEWDDGYRYALVAIARIGWLNKGLVG